MSTPFPPADRKNSDPEPYAPLLGGAAPVPQTGYYDRPSPGPGPNDYREGAHDYREGPHDYRDPYSEPYGDAYRQASDPYRQPVDNYRETNTPDFRDPYYGEQGRYDERPGGGEPDPFARSPSREARERADASDPYNPYHQNSAAAAGDIELRPLGPQKTSRFVPAPAALNTKDTVLFATGLDRVFRLVGVRMGESAEQVVQRRRRGMPGQRWPVMAYTLTISECARCVICAGRSDPSHVCHHGVRACREQQGAGQPHLHQALLQLYDRAVVDGAGQHWRALRAVHASRPRDPAQLLDGLPEQHGQPADGNLLD